MTFDEVRRLYRDIKQPPHHYYDIKNEKGTSPFGAGKPSSYYQAFVEHFKERAQTCDAQRRRFLRKGNLEGAARFEQLRVGWQRALETCLQRQTKAFLAEQLALQTAAGDAITSGEQEQGSLDFAVDPQEGDR